VSIPTDTDYLNQLVASLHKSRPQSQNAKGGPVILDGENVDYRRDNVQLGEGGVKSQETESEI
jgi:hypothetical protein